MIKSSEVVTSKQSDSYRLVITIIIFIVDLKFIQYITAKCDIAVNFAARSGISFNVISDAIVIVVETETE